MIGSASSSSSSIGVRNEAEELGCECSTDDSGVAAGFAATVGFAGGGAGVDASSVAIAGGTVRLVTTKTLAGEPRRTGTSTTGSAVTVGGATVEATGVAAVHAVRHSRSVAAERTSRGLS